MTAKLVLDCESFETAIDSLARVFQTQPDRLKWVLAQEEISTHYESHAQEQLSFKDYLFVVVEHHFGSPLSLDAVCWFHTTRTFAEATFSEGILPLESALPRLQAMLIEAIDDVSVKEQLQATLMSTGVADSHYFTKTNNSMHWGPYAILVRDLAFCAEEAGQHDYLRMPEIIEDICNGFFNTTGVALMDVFGKKLKPAIVKFTSKDNCDDSCISTALSYVYSIIQQVAPSSAWAFCFDGQNTPVSPQDILRIDFVNLGLVQVGVAQAE
jgi:hypothetical protein